MPKTVGSRLLLPSQIAVVCHGKRRGTSLVELLSVLAVIGILLALLLPTLFVARETARRMQCHFNLKQYGQALHHYHAVHQSFPAGQGGPHTYYLMWRGAGFAHADMFGAEAFSGNFSANLPLLPFLEQLDRYEMFLGLKGTHKNTRNMLPSPFLRNAEIVEAVPELGIVLRTRNSTWLCPSDPGSAEPSYHLGYARSNYVFSFSESIGYGESYNRLTFDTNSDQFPYRYKKLASRGAFGSLNWHSIHSFSDGTSNTIGMSEAVGAPGPFSLDLKGGIIIPSTAADLRRIRDIPSLCMITKGPGDTLTNGVPYANGALRWNLGRGGAPLCGMVHCTGFNTVLPPNSPNCAFGNSISHWGMFSASSMHPGGVNVLMMDASIRFVDEDVNVGRSDLLRRFSGPSPYGVWGALGTKDGGEPAPL